MPTAVTEGIRVSVEATYLPDRSSPDDGSFAFAYTVTIENESAPRAQLRRPWAWGALSKRPSRARQ